MRCWATRQPRPELDPRERLIVTAERILDLDLAAYELSIRLWALQDAAAARAVRKVTKTRLDLTRSAFNELGFEGDELEMRAMLFVGYHTGENAVFREISRKRRRQLIAQRIELLASR